MMNAFTVSLSLAVILISTGLSSQFDGSPNAASNPENSRRESPPSPGRQHLPGTNDSLGRNHSSENPLIPSEPSAGPSLRTRSISPAPNSSRRILGYTMAQLRKIRLIPNANPNKQFEIRRYTFPRDTPIKLKGIGSALLPITAREELVLLTSNGDILALFTKNNTILRGIYEEIFEDGHRIVTRVKINIHSSAIEAMTPRECEECPVSNRISKKFGVLLSTDLSLHI